MVCRLGKKNKPEILDPASINWDLIGYDHQLKLIQEVTKARKQNVLKDRNIYGLKTKTEVLLKFSKPTTFLGKSYPAGEHVVDVSQVLERHVEYVSPITQESVENIELHFRGGETAGQMSLSAWKFLEGAGLPKSHQHAHIVGPLPMERLVNNPSVETAKIVEFYRRANLAAEMIGVLEEGVNIHNIGSSRVSMFGPIDEPIRNYSRISYVWKIDSMGSAFGRTRKFGVFGVLI